MSSRTALVVAAVSLLGCTVDNPHNTAGHRWVLRQNGAAQVAFENPHLLPRFITQEGAIEAERCLCPNDHITMQLGSQGHLDEGSVAQQRFDDIVGEMRLEMTATCHLQALGIAGIEYAYDTCDQHNQGSLISRFWEDCAAAEPCPLYWAGTGEPATGGGDGETSGGSTGWPSGSSSGN